MSITTAITTQLQSSSLTGGTGLSEGGRGTPGSSVQKSSPVQTFPLFGGQPDQGQSFYLVFLGQLDQNWYRLVFVCHHGLCNQL